MYNRRLLISEDEKKHIKNLYGLILEQENLPGEKIKIDFGDLYGDGKYLIKNSNKFKEKLDSSLLPFVQKNPGVPLTIKVLGGESATPNYDYELNDNQGKPDFYLAKKRRSVMVDWLTNYFNNSEIEPKPIVDNSPNKEGVNVFRGRTGNEARDRFVDVVINAEAPGTCLVGLKIEVIYENGNSSPEFPCRGGFMEYNKMLKKEVPRVHKCDEAIFNVLLNDVNIGQVNLNNKVDGGSRNGVVEVTRAQALEIAKLGKNTIVLSLQCVLPNCHSDVAEIRITNKNGVLYHSCTPTLQSRGDSKVNDLLILDKCGTKIVQRSTKEVAGTGETKVKQEYGSQYWDAVAANKQLKKLADGSYEVLTDKLADPTGKRYKKGEIIPKPSF